jgi:hypothetical protein
VLIRIADDAPAERLQIRWQAALRICTSLLRGPRIHGCTKLGTDVSLSDGAGCDLATVMPVEVPSGPSDLPPRRLFDRQGWSTLLAGALLLLISFTTNYGDDNLLRFASLKTSHQRLF